MLRHRICKRRHDPCVDVEQVVARHPWFTRDACRDDDERSAAQGITQLGGSRVGGDVSGGGDVREVAGDALCVGNVVKGEVSDGGVLLEEKG